MSLLPLSFFLFAQGCLSAAINIPSGPTVDLKRSISVPYAHGAVRRQVANLDASTRISYQANVTFGKQTFALQIDTGSSDTWVTGKGYHCHTDACNEGPQYQMPGTFVPIPDVSLNASYGDGTIAAGPLGVENVTVGGITVHNALVSVATDITTNNGISAISGLIGLGYPAGTQAINSTTGESIPYDSIVARMFNEGLIKENSFSLALSSNGGKLAFGSLPKGVNYQKPWAEAKITPVILSGFQQTYAAYDINVGWSYQGADEHEIDNALMDSGSTVTSLPAKIVNAVNAQFKPPVNATDYSVDCKAKIPEFGPIIGGQKFLFKPEDMMTKNPDGSCTSNIQAGNGTAILGDVFLRSVLVVFDIGNQTLRFAKQM